MIVPSILNSITACDLPDRGRLRQCIAGSRIVFSTKA